MATAIVDLDEYLATKTAKGFDAVAHYYRDGDFASYFLSNERCYEKRIDDLVTVMLSMKTDRLIGVKVKGVKRILKEMGGREFIVTVTKRPVTVSLLLVGAGCSSQIHATSIWILERKAIWKCKS